MRKGGIMSWISVTSNRRIFLGLAAAAGFALGDASAEEIAFALRVDKGRVPANMQLVRVKQGDVVKLQWSTDRRMNLHLHGYDIEKTIEPGAVTEMTFTARATGRFPIAPHIPQATGGHGHGDALVTIEVYPR